MTFQRLESVLKLGYIPLLSGDRDYLYRLSQQSRLYLMMETDSNLRNVVF
jgi:hypothetical protein